MFSKRKCSFFLGVAVLLSARPAGAQATGAKRPEAIAVQDDPNRDVLRLAKVPTDGPGLLRFLEKLGGKDEDLLRLDALIAQLGDAQFAKRTEAAQKIVALQHAVIAKLKAAEQSKDAEIKARAKDCLKAIYRNHRLGIPLTAIRVLAKDRPAGLAEALLHFLPYTAEEEVQEEVWFTLYDLVKADPRKLPLMEKALKDPLAPRRALAGCVLGRLGSPAQQTAVQKLLADPDAHVRLRSAQGLLAGKNLAGVATLIALLEHPAVEISWSAEELLHYLAGDDAPPEKVGAASDKERLASRKAWETWWGKQEAKFDFKEVEKEYRRPALYLLIDAPGPSGRADPMGRIMLCGCTDGIRWQMQTDPPVELRLLPGNRFLVAGKCRKGSQISERALDGKVMWQPKSSFSFMARVDPEILVPETITLDDSVDVFSCRRMISGNTLISLSRGTLEIDENGGTVSFSQTPRSVKSTPKLLGNGRVLFRIEKLDGDFELVESELATGQERRRTRLPIRPRCAVLDFDELPNGNYLITVLHAQAPLAEIIEVNTRGETVCKMRQTRGQYGVRLRQGNTLIGAYDALLEFTADEQLSRELIVPGFSQFSTGSVHVVLALTGLGFDLPDRDNHDSINSIARRLRQIKSNVPGLRGYAIDQLNALGPKGAPAIPALVKYFDDPKQGDCRWVFHLLENIGDASFPALFEAAKHRRADLRATAFYYLERFTDKTNLILPVWLDALKDHDPTIRIAALHGISVNLRMRIRDKQQVPDAERKKLVKLVADARSDPATMEGAYIGLGMIGADALPFVIPGLKAKDLEERRCALNSLGDIGPDAGFAVPNLLEYFEAKDVSNKNDILRIRHSVISVFGRIGPNAVATTPLITRVLLDKALDPEFRRTAAWSLGRIGHLTEPVERALMEAQQDDNRQLREQATVSLRQLRKGEK